MSPSDKFWLIIWGTVATIGFVVVIIGVIIEGVEHFKKFPRNETVRKLKIEKLGWFLVVAGLAMEFLGDHAAKRISDREEARLNKEASDARLETAKLEQQIAETKTNVAKIDPLNQPITTATARVFLIENGTNTTGFDPNKEDITFASFVSLKLISSQQPTNGIHLICKSFKSFVGGGGGYNAGPNNFWVLEFGQDVMPYPLGGFGSLPDVRAATKCNEVLLDAPFLPIKTEIFAGHVTITINEANMEFDIPPQQIGRPSQNRILPVTVQW